MTKFKVGDKVRILRTDYNGAGLEVGSVHTVRETFNHGVELISCGEYDSGQLLYFNDSELELANNTLTVGQTYTSANGGKWECIFVRDGKAWLVGVYGGKPQGTAYDFDVDGTASWVSECDRPAYNIVLEPARETVTKKASVSTSPNPGETIHHEFMVTFDLVDGVADWDNAKVTAV